MVPFSTVTTRLRGVIRLCKPASQPVSRPIPVGKSHFNLLLHGSFLQAITSACRAQGALIDLHGHPFLPQLLTSLTLLFFTIFVGKKRSIHLILSITQRSMSVIPLGFSLDGPFSPEALRITITMKSQANVEPGASSSSSSPSGSNDSVTCDDVNKTDTLPRNCFLSLLFRFNLQLRSFFLLFSRSNLTNTQPTLHTSIDENQTQQNSC